jgi:phosphatidylserine decarboxylase
LAEHPWAKSFEGGSFATIYLAPFNYHRVHMAVRGTLTDTVYVPGRLFSVNTVTAQHVPNLFARNERVLTLFETDFGRFALVLVGALNVGSIATVWAGDLAPGVATRGGQPPAARRAVTRIPGPAVTLEKGAELGRFNMGSTVILLFEPNRAQWHPLLREGSVVQLGRAIGSQVAPGRQSPHAQQPAGRAGARAP